MHQLVLPYPRIPFFVFRTFSQANLRLSTTSPGSHKQIIPLPTSSLSLRANPRACHGRILNLSQSIGVICVLFAYAKIEFMDMYKSQGAPETEIVSAILSLYNS
ncbi:hypothetical protein L596_012935 [Steinernema carpocapsae]|uniref:Uncharacterized protein n=1 Tax=Steinernema carpocapsae TaxID=34508 RepID=A0A4U5NYJ9_STECR|nr:hypothetical protein L596_012935 [Steinernema carpocapsae]